MSKHEKELAEKIRNAPHQRKTEDADIVVYDSEGNWVFEAYCPDGGSVQVGRKRLFLDDVRKRPRE